MPYTLIFSFVMAIVVVIHRCIRFGLSTLFHTRSRTHTPYIPLEYFWSIDVKQSVYSIYSYERAKFFEVFFLHSMIWIACIDYQIKLRSRPTSLSLYVFVYMLICFVLYRFCCSFFSPFSIIINVKKQVAAAAVIFIYHIGSIHVICYYCWCGAVAACWCPQWHNFSTSS